MQLRRALRLRCSADEPRARVVVHVPRRFGQNRLKRFVHRVQHFRRTSIVARQINSLALPAGKARQLLQKEPWLRLTEAIDGLLDVAHEKQVVPAGDPVEYRLLHAIAILIFVHGDPAKLRAVFLRNRFVSERFQRQMLKVVVVQRIRRAFGFGVLPLEAPRNLHERANRPAGMPQHSERVRPFAGKALELFLDEILARRARILSRLFLQLRRSARKAKGGVLHAQKRRAIGVVSLCQQQRAIAGEVVVQHADDARPFGRERVPRE
ncbi:hypothetical protein SDC9_104743 [bioreactor metagenome]|uniref:Uncharacterized protein n=1 Tax=bioreactor metagenome TaxID=1076179 RepID=A0A645B891_9ZZZZ